ncbi:hypothetical protein [Nitrosospira sp. NpAV]|uniref:hypothetical protein n=1 Tax=Nitrosospira sp. NpAV TaxID=58133 RepID=UPI00059F6524|nr:hypothetical protein [Nitrosospira sp. NpAV]KIO48173.1 hypothetical protein SQ11_13515 [Nitrosospira sp. NpAV]
MRKTIGWAASWVLYYLSGYVDLARARFGAGWLYPTYSRLLNASDDAQTWGGGGGTWVHGTPGENEHWPYLGMAYGKNNRLKNKPKNISREVGRLAGWPRGMRKFFRQW